MSRVHITGKVESFRRKLRSVWDITLGDCDADIELTEPFFEFRRLMFWTLVADNWPQASIRANDPLVRSTIGLREGEIRVEARSSVGLPITLNADMGRMCGNWRRETTYVDTLLDHVCLVDIFDWNEQSAMDHEFYKVKVMSSVSQPSLVGFYGIIRPQDCLLFWEEPPE